ncbi:hypothetical protein LMH73_008760 [Vibrio splendidus]|nr:hypothetical protein [Vibrio splendidus]MCC4879442.1 hypothetical protein [Vibrio splendidus]
MENNNSLPLELLTDLESALAISASETVDVIKRHFPIPKIEYIKPLVAQYGNLLGVFNFVGMNADRSEVRELFAAALISRRDNTSPFPLLNKLSRHDVVHKYLKEHVEFFDRELYLMVKESFFDEENIADKVTTYLRYFVEHLTTEDFIEIWDRFFIDKPPRVSWMFRCMIRPSLERGIVPDELLIEALKKTDFKSLNEDTRNKHAALAVDLHFGNYKYINDENKVLLADKINYFDKPLMIMHHPDRDGLAANDWKRMLLKDMRVLRLIPHELLSNGTLFSDDYLLELLEENSSRSTSRRYRLIRFLFDVAPERLTPSFCNQIRERKLPEQHHPFVVALQVK